MIIVTIKMKALPDKFLELKQTLFGLMEAIREEKGCLLHNVLQDMESENSLSLVGQWESWEDLDAHVHSNRFAVLMGTRSLLTSPPVIMIHTVIGSAGWCVKSTDQLRKNLNKLRR